MAPAKRPSRAMLWLTVVAAPSALALETALRWLLFPPQFEEVREFLEPALTPIAWGLCVVAVVASVVGTLLQARLSRAKIARHPATDLDKRYAEAFGVFLLTASVPQIPALLSTFGYMFGASLWPVIAGIVLSSVGVVLQALRVPSLAEG